MFTVRKPYQLLLICCAVLLVYYPAIFGVVSLLDDRDMVSWLINSNDLDLKNLFIPRSSGGGYYRPLIGLSYLVDRFVWGTMPQIMHFENVFLHLLNALLLFKIADRLFNRTNRHPVFPLAAALLYGLHPIATESVCWISGRTDILAGNFVLGATWLVVRYNETRRFRYLALALVAVFMGALAKETALAFIPAALLILWGGRRDQEEAARLPLTAREIVLFTAIALGTILLSMVTYNFWITIFVSVGILIFLGYKSCRRAGIRRNIPAIGLLLGSGIAAGGGFWCIRQVAFTSNTSRISQTISLMLGDLNYAIQLFLGANGFYLRKFLFPLPLNAAIREIDPLYTLAGALLLFLCVILLARPSLLSGFFLAGFCMTVPVLPFAFGTIAWTAYAERYIYLSIPFWLLAAGYLLPQITSRRWGVTAWMTPLLLILASGVVVQRCMVWGNNLAMTSDMVAKSPDFKMAHGLYMSALVEEGRYREAEEQYRIAAKLPAVFYEENYDLLLACCSQREGRNDEAERVLLSALKKTGGKKPVVLQALAAFYEDRRREVTDSDAERVERLQLLYTKKLYELNNDPHTLYQVAKLYLRTGEKDAGVKALQKVMLTLPAKDPGRAAVERLLGNQ